MQIAVNIKNRFAIWYFMFPDGVGRTNTFYNTKIQQFSKIFPLPEKKERMLERKCVEKANFFMF